MNNNVKISGSCSAWITSLTHRVMNNLAVVVQRTQAVICPVVVQRIKTGCVVCLMVKHVVGLEAVQNRLH